MSLPYDCALAPCVRCLRLAELDSEKAGGQSGSVRGVHNGVPSGLATRSVRSAQCTCCRDEAEAGPRQVSVDVDVGGAQRRSAILTLRTPGPAPPYPAVVVLTLKVVVYPNEDNVILSNDN